jgi:hypothetical protein
MKKLLLIVAILFAACGTTHKIKTQTTKNVDSTVTTVKDSTKVSNAQNYTDNFVAKGVDITFDYGKEQSTDTPLKAVGAPNHDTVAWKPFYYKPSKGSKSVEDLIKEAISNSGSNGQIPTSITVHIDSLSNQSSSSSTKDSAVVKATTEVNVKEKDTSKIKDVKRTGTQLWVLYIVLGLGGLIALLVGGYKLAKKFKLIA